MPDRDAPGGTDKAALDAFTEQTVRTYYHPGVTTRMGTDAASVGVGPTLAVHGVSSLHMVDASVISAITRATIQAPIIAERGADLLRSAA